MVETLCRAKDVAVMRVQSIEADNGTLLVAEVGHHVPFPVKRAFAIVGTPVDSQRGHHAHRRCHQFLVCLSGSIWVLLDDGSETVEMILNCGDALHIPPGLWAEQVYQSEGASLLVLCDQLYDESDYLRDHDEFLSWRQINDISPN